MCLCPLHHGVGVVHVLLAPALRYYPESSRTPPKLHAPAFVACAAFSLLPAAFPGVRSFLVCWLPLAFFPPCPCFVWSYLPASLACFLVGLVYVVLLCAVCLWLVSRFRVLLLSASPHVLHRLCCCFGLAVLLLGPSGTSFLFCKGGCTAASYTGANQCFRPLVLAGLVNSV